MTQIRSNYKSRWAGWRRGQLSIILLAETVRKRRVDGSISPQLRAPVQDVHVHLQQGLRYECIHFIYWNNICYRGDTEGPDYN